MDEKWFQSQLELMQNKMVWQRLYQDYCKAAGIAEGDMWVLYYLLAQEQPMTQAELSDTNNYNRQTVNMTLKRLANRGWIRLEFVPRNRKSKYILLTEAGRAVAERWVRSMWRAQQTAMERMSPDWETFLKLFGRYNQVLREELEKATLNT